MCGPHFLKAAWVDHSFEAGKGDAGSDTSSCHSTRWAT